MRHLRAGIAAVLLLAACGDGTAPPRPAALAPVSGDGATPAVGSAHPVAVRVTDAGGAPVAGAAVQWSVETGGGTVSPASGTTGADGTAAATWTLGGGAGAQTLAARVGALPPLTFAVTAAPGAPASLAAHGTLPATAPVTTRVEPAVQVRDAHGNVVPGAPVAFAVVAGGGTVEAATAAADAEGIARPGGWTLGSAAGANTLRASLAGGAEAVLSVAGAAGPAAALEAAAGEGQSAEAGTMLDVRPAVRVRDAHGNPVAGVAVSFAVTAGGGTLSGPAQTTGADGTAWVGSWRLGPEPGENALTATVDGLPPVVITAEGLPSTFNLRVVGIHLNQGNQDEAGTTGAVAGRPGLLRVVVRASAPNAHRPPVRVRLYRGGALVREEMLAAPPGGVPAGGPVGDAASTWNLALSAAEVTGDLSVEAEVDPEGTVPDSDPADNRFPRGSGTRSLDVRPLPALRVVFFPVHVAPQGLTGNVTPGNVDSFLDHVRRWIPSASIVPSVRAPYTTGVDLRNGSNWTVLLSEVQAVRTAEGATDQYYHGIVPFFSGTPWGGFGYIPTTPGSPFRSAITYDRPGWASQLVAHELGHNLGRRHSPCGGPAGVDPEFPYADGGMGAPGYDVVTGTVVPAGHLRDVMGYCYPQWVSDYTFRGILQWRRSDPLGVQGAVAAAAAAPVEGVLLWGRVGSGEPSLSPAFTLVTRPVLPAQSGPHELRGIAGDGTVLFRLRFAGERVDHAADPAERHFSFFVPLSPADQARLERIELATARGTVARRAPALADAAAGAAPAEARVERAGAGRVRVRWDAHRFPMAMVRDPATGRVLAIGRGGSVEVAGAPAGAVEVLLSDGVRSRRVP